MGYLVMIMLAAFAMQSVRGRESNTKTLAFIEEQQQDDQSSSFLSPDQKSKKTVCKRTINLNAGDDIIFFTEDKSSKKKYSCKTTFLAPLEGKLKLECEINKNLCKIGLLKINGKKVSNKECKAEEIAFTSKDNKITLLAKRIKKKSVLLYACKVTALGEKLHTTTPANLVTTASPKPKPTTIGALTKCECGLRNINGLRVTGGENTEHHEYPYQVGLIKKGSSKPFCGGSIINNDSILTAAHCVVFIKNVSDYQVLIGEHDLTVVTYEIKADIKEVIPHKTYNKITLKGDIAIVVLEKPLTFSEKNSRYHPVCIANSGSYTNKNVIVSGWGHTQHEGEQPNELQDVELKVLSSFSCFRTYQYIFESGKLCASNGKSKGSCNGDSGGPLMYEHKSEHFEQIGVVSAGIKCAETGSPSLFTKVSYYYDWIKANAGEIYTAASPQYDCAQN